MRELGPLLDKIYHLLDGAIEDGRMPHYMQIYWKARIDMSVLSALNESTTLTSTLYHYRSRDKYLDLDSVLSQNPITRVFPILGPWRNFSTIWTLARDIGMIQKDLTAELLAETSQEGQFYSHLSLHPSQNVDFSQAYGMTVHRTSQEPLSQSQLPSFRHNTSDDPGGGPFGLRFTPYVDTYPVICLGQQSRVSLFA